MQRFSAVLAIAVLAAPVWAGLTYFQVTGDGCFDTYRSSSGPEGYSNGGGAGIVRLEKYNQNMGWMSFYGSTADGSGLSLTTFLATHPSATAKLYVRSANVLLGTTGTYLISMRTGNQDSLVEDQGNGNGYGPVNPDPGFTGASELEAFRGCSTLPLAIFPNFGDGIYTLEDPNRTDGIQGTPWVTPSTRLPNTGASPFKWGPHQAVQYDTGVLRTSDGLTPPRGKYIGFFPDPDGGNTGRSYYALEDVLGMFNNNSRNASLANITDAGQIMNGGNVTPLLVNNAMYVASEPRQKSGGVTNNWLGIPVDAAFLADMAFNPENKGFVFANNVNSQPADFSNADYYTKEQAGGIYSAYLAVTPEPATLCLLALAGLVVLRRRHA